MDGSGAVPWWPVGSMVGGAGGEVAEASESARLRREVAELRREVAVAEAQVAELTAWCIALGRLYTAPDVADVRRAVCEIVINVIGSEEFGIWEPAGGGGSLLLVESMGIDPVEWGSVALGEGPIGGAAERGEPSEAPGASAGDREGGGPLACVPLRAGGELVGVVAVFGLLPHKRGLDARDRELLGLLMEHAGRAWQWSRRRMPPGLAPGAGE